MSSKVYDFHTNRELMKLINFSLKNLVKNSSEDKFKYLPQMICGKQSKLVWLKGMYPYEYMNSFPRFKETKLPDKKKNFDVFELFVSRCTCAALFVDQLLS